MENGGCGCGRVINNSDEMHGEEEEGLFLLHCICSGGDEHPGMDIRDFLVMRLYKAAYQTVANENSFSAEDVKYSTFVRVWVRIQRSP